MNALPDLQAFASQHGLSAIGVADMEALQAREPAAMASVPSGLSRGIALGVRLADAVLDELTDGPTPLYFHTYRQANYILDRAAFQLALAVQASGSRALPVPASQIIGGDGRRGLVSHRLIGHAAAIRRARRWTRPAGTAAAASKPAPRARSTNHRAIMTWTPASSNSTNSASGRTSASTSAASASAPAAGRIVC